MALSPWQIEIADGPIVAVALHDGHEVRPEVAAMLRLDDAARLYEEDPFTGSWTDIAPTRIVVRRSRFELDLNRPRTRAVYLEPEDAWGLEVWKSPPPISLVVRSLANYDDFYAVYGRILREKIGCHGRVVVFDLHSYNHRRAGPGDPPADPQLNPEVNVGTGSLDRQLWARVVERFIAEARSADHFGRCFDVRENVRFRGGELAKWTHAKFPGAVCALAIEVKKFFMDEWTGELNDAQHTAVRLALGRAATGVLEELNDGDQRTNTDEAC